MSTQIEALRKLGLDEKEIADVLECDKQINKGAKLFELNDEQKAVEKKSRQTGSRTVYNFTKRERKANSEKAGLVETLISAITEQGATNLEVANAEREFTFLFNDTKYKIVLSAPRT